MFYDEIKEFDGRKNKLMKHRVHSITNYKKYHPISTQRNEMNAGVLLTKTRVTS